MPTRKATATTASVWAGRPPVRACVAVQIQPIDAPANAPNPALSPSSQAPCSASEPITRRLTKLNSAPAAAPPAPASTAISGLRRMGQPSDG
ncbi:MAG TPA: hypothetical protein VF306_00475 [Pirellulales bacterium]